MHGSNQVEPSLSSAIMLRLVMCSLLQNQKPAVSLVPVMYKHAANRRRALPSAMDMRRAALPVGTEIEVVISKMGQLGASVKLVGEPGTGLILRKELLLLMDRRRGKAVRVGETLTGYVQNIRETGKIDVSLRPPRAKDKAIDAKRDILQSVQMYGTIPVGDKSSPADIGRLFPGVSKTVFKNAVGLLYKERKVTPGDFEVSVYNNSSSS